jgi:TPR repeat protein
MRNLLWFLTLTLTTITISSAADFATGMEAYKKGDYVTAAKEWRPLAEQGDAADQFNLGLLYLDGQGVPQDLDQAIKWFTRAAQQDYDKAQLNLGAMYASGKGLKRDYVQAYKWLNICASRGNAKCVAQRDLVAKKLSASKLAGAQHLASEWAPKKEEPPK